MHQYNYQYIFILVWRSTYKVSWQKQWSHDNCNPLIFATGKRCRKHPVCCLFALNTPNCLQQNENFKISQRKHSRFELAACTLQRTEPLALIVPGTSHLREESCKSHPVRLCQHPPSSNGLVGSPHTWQHFQEHIGSCLTTFRIKILLAKHVRTSEKLPKHAASSEQNHLHKVEERGTSLDFAHLAKYWTVLIASRIRDYNKGSELTLWKHRTNLKWILGLKSINTTPSVKLWLEAAKMGRLDNCDPALQRTIYS